MTTYERQIFITGNVYELSRHKRHLYSPWYISMVDYPYDHYPPFVQGGCILTTRYNARLFYIASKYIRLFPFDDVYIGMLAYSMSIPLIKNNKRFGAYDTKINLKKTEFPFLWTRFDDEAQICVHGYRGQELLNIWNKLHKTNIKLDL